jgi:arylformamidase
MDKADFSYVARALRPVGAATVVIDYGLVPTIDLDELVRQCRAAVAWVHRHARQWGGDPERITVCGHSAGGHLTAMMLATDWRAWGLPADVVKGACAISGLYDLEPIRLCYLNHILALTPESARRNSPVHLAPTGRPPLVLAVGGAEGPEYHRQTDDLAAAWRAHGLSIEVMDLAGHDHFSIMGELSSPGTELARAIHRQLGLR